MESPLLEVQPRVARRAVTLLGAAPGARWCTRVAERVPAVAAALGLGRLEVWDRGRSSWLLTAEGPDGPVVVKAPVVDPAGHFAAQRVLASAGVGPEIVYTDDVVAVMERVPGVPLGEVCYPHLHLPGVAAALERLSAAPAEVDGLGSLVEWLAPRVAATPAGVAPSPELRDEAAAALEGLAGGVDGPCHGDLDPGNVVVGRDGAVRLVGARGVRGDVHYDLATLAVKAGGDRAGAERLAVWLAGSVGLDGDRAVGWVPVVLAARV